MVHEQPEAFSDFWLAKIKREGVRLTVEIDLSFDQFRKLLDSPGAPSDDVSALDSWRIVNRRILPPDAGSFSGIGFEVGELVRESLQ